MIFPTTTTTTIFSALLLLITVSQVLGSGDVEVVVTSPETVLMSHSVCTNVRCNTVSSDARRIKLNANVPFRFDTAPYEGEAPRYFDLNLKFMSLNEEEIATVFHTPDGDTTWKNDFVTTKMGFNVTYQYRTRCDNHYFGSRCNVFCQDSVDRHTECTASGERRCMQGWTGNDCSTPICSKSCNGKGTCVAPGQCKCKNGYTGYNCEECVPRRGCVHGGCANNVSFTCSCLPGFGGELCNIDLEICQRQQPCHNGGVCSNEGPKGFTCKCALGFGGERCEVPIKKEICSASESGANMCMNGGTCISSSNSFECKCQPGFYGRFCENKEVTDPCGGCKNGGTCAYGINGKPVCQCGTCYKGPNCEFLDAECLLLKMGEKINQSKGKMHVANIEVAKKMPSNDDSDLSTKQIFLAVAILIGIIGVLFIIFIRCTRTKKTSLSNDSMMSTFPSTPRKQSKLVYQACVIDAEQLSDSEMEPTNTRRSVGSSPPPAYYPPFPKYASTTDNKHRSHADPTSDFQPFQHSSLEATIV